MEIENIFPYHSFRTGQRELALAVYNTCKNGSNLVIDAMSGFGKTAPVLAGSILAAEERDAKIVYACRTKRQVYRVMEELKKIQQRIPLQSSYLFSKSDYCLLRETSKFSVTQESFKWYCSFNVTNNLCSFFLNLSLLNKEVSSILRKYNTSSMLHSDLLSECRNVHVCPYEIARLAMTNSRIIVTTYHYIFDDATRSTLFTNSQFSPSEMYVIVDEAHNIREFMRDAHTSSLSFKELEQAIKDSEGLHLDRVTSSLREIIWDLKSFSSQHESWYVDKNDFMRLVTKHKDTTWLPNLVFELSALAKVGWESIATGKNLPASIIKVGDFLSDTLSSIQTIEKTMTKSDEGFSLVNTDPSRKFADTIREFRSLILLSATINPSDLFLRSIGLEKDTMIHKVDLGQTFKVRTVIDTGVSTRFKLRDSNMYSKITEKIFAVVESVRGGIGIFAPSYPILEILEQHLQKRIRGRELLCESRSMDNSDADRIMRTYKSTPGSILLAVQGGKFSEGEDFPGDQMDVSVVVGLSLPPPSPLIYAELAQKRLSGHEAYLVVSLLPALRKAIQSAGRHIRSPDKQGMVFFLDSRFNSREVMDIIPPWLKHDVLSGDFNPVEIRRIIQSFWSYIGST